MCVRVRLHVRVRLRVRVCVRVCACSINFGDAFRELVHIVTRVSVLTFELRRQQPQKPLQQQMLIWT